jgi:opacity protein-like surface antigen
MRQTFEHGKRGLALAALALALMAPGVARASSAPFVRVAQQHNVEHEKQKGVMFHLTARVDGLKGQPCTLAVACYEKNGKSIKSLRKEYAHLGGGLVATQALTPKYDSTKVDAKIFLPYDAITRANGAQEIEIIGAVRDDRADKFVGVTTTRDLCRFNPSASPEEAREAARRFEQQRAAIAGAWQAFSNPRPTTVSNPPTGGYRYGYRYGYRWEYRNGRYGYYYGYRYEYYYDPTYRPGR